MQAAAAIRHPCLLAPSVDCSRRRPSSTVRMALCEDGPSVAIMGATGVVGQEFLHVITDRDFPYRSLRLLAGERSTGKRLAFEDREYTVQDLAAPGAFDGVDIMLFSTGGGVSRKYGPTAVASGTVVVDNSSAFRMDPEVPLVIPKVLDKDDVAVGRIRQDLSQDDNRGLNIFVCGNSIRKGAALNAVQIAKMLLKRSSFCISPYC